MWDFFQTLRHRHSVRKYQHDMPVEESKLHGILEAACAAPSAGDLQSYRIIVVTESGLRADLSTCADQQAFLAEAPVCLVFCADVTRAKGPYGARGAKLYSIQDATIAAAYAQLATVATGLSTTWVGRFDEAGVRRALDLDAGLRPVALLTLGYAAEVPQDSPRRPMTEVIHRR
jgi:nitroreductase